MKNKIKNILAIGMIIFAACEEGIDPITSVSPGSDELAPAITLSAPASSKIIIPVTETQTDVAFSFVATDDIELGSIVVTLDGSQQASFDSFKDYRRLVNSFTKSAMQLGHHTLEIKATDLTGKSTTHVHQFEISNEYQPAEGEIFYMSFEQGQLLDLISEDNGTSAGTVTFTEGVKGDAIRLDGASKSYVLFPGDALTDLESFSISFWVNPEFVDADADDGIDGILGLVNLSNTKGFWGNIDLFVENGTTLESTIIKGHIANANGTETWVDNITGVADFFGGWSHHVMVYDGGAGEFQYYINGESIATKAAGWGTDPLSFADVGPMVFGAVHFQTEPSLTEGSGTQPWASYLTGKMDEIRIFNRSLSAADVTAIYEDAN